MAAHHLRREWQRSARDFSNWNMFLIDEANVSFVNQGRSFAAMWPFAPGSCIGCAFYEVRHRQRVQLVERSLISVAPFSKQLSKSRAVNRRVSHEPKDLDAV